MAYAKFIFVTMLSCLAFVPGSRAQEWQPVTDSVAQDSAGNYYKYAPCDVSCKGEFCMAVCEKWPKFYSVKTPPVFVFLRSRNGGLTWSEINPHLDSLIGFNGYITPTSYDIYKIQVIDTNTIVACGDGALVIRSSDGGMTWKSQTLDTNHYQTPPHFMSIHFSDPASGIVTKDGGYATDPDLYITNDSGNHWKPVTLLSDPQLSAEYSYGSGMFRVGSADSNVIYTTHDNWNSYDSIIGSGMHYGGGYSFSSDSGLVMYHSLFSYPLLERSSDGGEHWEIDTGFDISIMSSANQSPIFSYGYSNSDKLYVSTDTGSSWQARTASFATGVPMPFINDIAVTGSGAAIGIISNDGTFPWQQRSVPIGYLAYLPPLPARVDAVPSSANGFGIYPNPARNTLTILHSAGTLSILDPLGRRYPVRRSGNTLDVSLLPAGVYFISDGHSRVKFVKE